MGTRSLTVLKDSNDNEICVMYRQFDGYPTGHGKDLADFLSGITIVNGISGDESGRIANGLSCLSAQIIAHFKKDDVGGIYLHPSGTRDVWEEFTYIVSGKVGSEPTIEVNIDEDTHFSGPASEFLTFIENLNE